MHNGKEEKNALKNVKLPKISFYIEQDMTVQKKEKKIILQWISKIEHQQAIKYLLILPT